MQTVWQDLEVEAEMQRGLLPGLVVLSAKFLPTLRSATARTMHSVAQVTIAKDRYKACNDHSLSVPAFPGSLVLTDWQQVSA